MSFRYEGRSPVDILLARAAQVEREARREIQGIIHGDRGPYLGWKTAHSPKEQKELLAESLRLVEEAMALEKKIAAERPYAAHSTPYLPRAGGPSSRRVSKRR